MNRPAHSRPLLALLRGSARLAGLVLALFLSTTVMSVACAEHDLADAGVGVCEVDASTPDSPAPDGSDWTTHASGHCCHMGGCHVPALASLIAMVTVDAGVSLARSEQRSRPSASVRTELRPPIL